MNLIAKIPKLAAIIYRNNYFNGKIIESDDSLDLAGNYSHMMGYDSHGMKECLRGYLSIHRLDFLIAIK
jgi:citrate synthase